MSNDDYSEYDGLLTYEGYWGWTDNGRTTLDADMYSDSYNMFYTVFHETRHMRGENHSGDEFDDWETFLQDSCPDSSKR